MNGNEDLDQVDGASRAGGRGQWVVNLLVGLGAAFFLFFGAWAFCWPENFYQVIAQFPPFNLHLFHDTGAFQLGIGAGLLGALFFRDALFVGLLGGAVGSVIHAISHIVDRDLGGRPADPWVLSGLAVLLSIAAVLRLRSKPTTNEEK